MSTESRNKHDDIGLRGSFVEDLGVISKVFFARNPNLDIKLAHRVRTLTWLGLNSSKMTLFEVMC